MGASQERIQLVILDLKSSNYFRVWALLWLVCFVIWWVGLGIMSHKAEVNAEHNYMRTYVDTNVSQLQYPNFDIRVGGFENPALQINNNSVCYYGNFFYNYTLQYVPCPASINYFNTSCIYFNTQNNNGVNLIAHNNASEPFLTERIWCTIYTTGNVEGLDDQLAYEDQSGDPNIGPNSGPDIWFGPNGASWILLSLFYYDNQPQWERDLLYHSDVFGNTTMIGGQQMTVYNVSILMNTFNVVHFNSYDFYNSFLTASDIGGFAFLLIIVHKVTMFLIGFALTNDSRFLNNNSDAAKYNSV